MSTEIPIIESLMKWIREQDPSLHLEISDSRHYFNIGHNRTRLGQVTLIFPDQDIKQGLQYDWYRDIWPVLETDPNARYYRMVFEIADPNSFSEILKTAQSLRDGKDVAWHKVYRLTHKGIILIGDTDA